ncbi:MAG: hypothetical protein HKN50_05350 [Gammaproteobacteria bacterium]|nr:hypothetical protein [Gammaproteobacteria bacterium]
MTHVGYMDHSFGTTLEVASNPTNPLANITPDLFLMEEKRSRGLTH